MRKLTHEEQVEAIAKINPNIEVLGRSLMTVHLYYVSVRFVTMNGLSDLTISREARVALDVEI